MKRTTKYIEKFNGENIPFYKDMNGRIYSLSNWARALNKANGGCDISPIIHWGFTHDDIVELTNLHKAGKYQNKIEDLLEDCNFHYEMECLYKHDYNHVMDKLVQD